MGRRQVRQLILSFIIAAILLGERPGPVLAQGTNDAPPPAPVVTPVEWDDIPDILEYVEFAMPQCAGPNSIGLQRRSAVAGGGGWWDLGRSIGWLAWQVENSFVGFSCWLLGVNQHLFNALAILTNSLIAGMNFCWRLLIFCWLHIRAFVSWGVFLVELVRGLWWTLLDLAQWSWEMAIDMWNGFIAIMQLLWQYIQLLVALAQALLGLIGWIGGITTTTIREVMTSIFWEPGGQGSYSGSIANGRLTAQEQLYCGVRGILDAVQQHSQSGWMITVLQAISYVAFVFWLIRYVAGAGAGAEE